MRTEVACSSCFSDNTVLSLDTRVRSFPVRLTNPPTHGPRQHLHLDTRLRSVFTLCDITYSRLTSSASSQLFDKRMLSLSDSRGLRLPWFIPSVLPSTCPHLLQFNEPTHVLVAPCSSSPSPGRCGFIRSSLPSNTGSVRPSHVGGTARHRHLRVGAASQLVTAISGSVRPLLLLLLVAASRRQHSLGLTGTSTHFVLFLFVCCLFVPTHGSD